MKDKKLIIPYSFEERKPLLLDRVIFVPPYYGDHEMPYDSSGALFSDFSKVCVEYCSGNGQWICEKAKSSPDIAWVAVERRLDRARRIYAKMHKQNITNLFLVFGDGEPFTKYYVDKNSIDEIFINFPDPWPKKRHAKNRIIQPEFLSDLIGILKEGGAVTFVTDNKPYLDEATSIFLDNQDFSPVFEKPYYTNELEAFGSSFFSSLFLAKGELIYYLKLTKNSHEYSRAQLGS